NLISTATSRRKLFPPNNCFRSIFAPTRLRKVAPSKLQEPTPMSRTVSRLSASLLLVPALLAASIAQAHQAGDIIVRAGAVTVDPREDSSGIKHAVAGNLGGKATLDSDTQLGLNFAYMLTDKVGIELLAATPFSHDVGVQGLGAPIDGKLGSIKHLPPTVSLVYYPLDNSSAFKPYVGAGVNFTWFF